MIAHLYVHIPFCPKVCPYCSFYKEAGGREKIPAFIDALWAEAEGCARALRPQTLFFGGGTPTALSTRQLESLIGGLHSRLDLSRLTEFTVEMNPATVSLEKAAALRALGVNRISMGVQSWDPRLLETLGRVHTGPQARRSYEILREAGFDNINLDLMFGIPGQTADQWRTTLQRTLDLQPDHISAYCLTYEEDTEYFLRLHRGDFHPDEALDADLFEMTMDTLAAAGFEAYEISNHAQPGRECLHNLAYWFGRDSRGLGPSAFSSVGPNRWKNISDTSAYIARMQAGEDPADFHETVDPATRRVEQVAFSLRTNRGVRTDLLPPDKTESLIANGLLIRRGPRSHLTRKGRMVADEVAASVI